MSDPSVWMAIFMIVGVLAGTACGVLMWMGGMRPPLAVATGGGSAITVALFLMTAAEFVTK